VAGERDAQDLIKIAMNEALTPAMDISLSSHFADRRR
jgi:hypothetical protein